MARVNVIYDNENVNKEKLSKLLAEANCDSAMIYDIGYKMVPEGEPYVILIHYTEILRFLSRALEAEREGKKRKSKMAVGVIGVGDRGTIYFDNPHYYNCNLYIVGNKSLEPEEVLRDMATKSWFQAGFVIK